jgi:hypothetical protein
MFPPTRLARVVLVAFLITFICTRMLVFLIMAHRIPDLYLYIGETHVHHLNYGILLLVTVGAYLLFAQPKNNRTIKIAAIGYGIGLALTFDEFGTWLSFSTFSSIPSALWGTNTVPPWSGSKKKRRDDPGNDFRH